MSANEPTRKNEGRPSATPTNAILGLPKIGKHAQSGIPCKWEKHRKRLVALRAHVEAERRNHALVAREPLESFSMNMADAATDEFDHNLALTYLSAEQAALYEIDEALARIKDGTYGICEITGKPIPEGRLNALPWTRFSGDVERHLERTGRAPHVRLGQLRSVTGQVAAKLAESETGDETSEPIPSDEALSRIPTSPKK